MAKKTPMRPSWTANVGMLIDQGVEVRACCDHCGKWRTADLAMTAAALGRDYDLWNRATHCTLTEGCPGRVRFMHGGRGAMQGMWD